jgi:hypothetical protein
MIGRKDHTTRGTALPAVREDSDCYSVQIFGYEKVPCGEGPPRIRGISGDGKAIDQKGGCLFPEFRMTSSRKSSEANDSRVKAVNNGKKTT